MSTTDNGYEQAPPPPPPPIPPAPPRRRLQRSRSDRVIAGVAGGLGEYFDVDPVIFRIAFVGLAFLGGAGLLLYPAAWLLLPEEGHHRSIIESWVRHGGRAKWLPITLIVIGSVILFGDLSSRHRDGGIGFALIVIVIGVLLMRRRPVPPRPPDPWSMTPPTPDQPAAPPASDAPTTELPPTETPTAELPPPPWNPPPLAPPTGGGGYWGPTADELRPPDPTGRSLATMVLSILLIAGGVAGLLHVTDVATVSVPGFLAGALIFTGVALLASAWYGGTGGLVAIAIILTVALAIAAVVRTPLRGGFGDRRYVPSSVDEIRPRYRLGAGQATVDLSHVALPADGRTLRASVGAGELDVVLPDQGRVVVVAHAGLGDLQILGRHKDGWDVDERVVDGDPAFGTLTLDLDVSAGEINVTRAGDVVPFRLRPRTTELPPAPPAPPAPPTPTTPEVPTSAAA